VSATSIDLIREQAAQDPAHPALLADLGAGRLREVSYAELVGRFDAHAKRLRGEGVAAGDRCGLVARQGAGFIELALGVLAAGACLVPIPDEPRGPALEGFARRARLHHLIAEQEDGGFERRPGPDPSPVDGAGDAHFRALRPAYLRFTSGTTSRRKGVILGHAAVLARLAAANRGLAIGSGDRVLWLLPMAHHFVVSILLYLSRGATVLLPASTLARSALELGQRAGATVLYASPYHHNLLVRDASELALPELRLAVSTAEGLRAEVAESFRARFGRPLVQALGIIEVGLPVLNLHSAEKKPTSLGRPLPDYEVWLRGEDGRPLEGASSPARTGELCIRGPGLLDAYLEPWLPAAQVLEAGSFATGDQGFFDAEGDLFLAGRRATRINLAGMKFFGEEVEAVLDTHPGVRESRVFGRTHAHLGEIPVAEVVPADPAHPPERGALLAHCRAHLPAYQVPRELRLVPALPRTATGKLRRSDEVE
jgi:long-chain acyl-CoA synthetase